MSDYLEPEPRYTRKATPEEIRASNRDPLVWFVVGVFTLFTCGALTHSPGVDACPNGRLRSRKCAAAPSVGDECPPPCFQRHHLFE